MRKEKLWTVELAISEKVYLYRYPFYLPKEFLTYENIHDLRAKICFLLLFSITDFSALPVNMETLGRQLSPEY